MPFTLSHTVAVIPLYKYLGKFGALSALIIGSMTPDFAYLTPTLVYQRVDSHTLLGIYLYCIPMGLTVYFLYHWLMAPVIVSLFPQGLKKHLHHNLFLGIIPRIPSFILIFSLILGAFTHVFWDFFTHQSGAPQYIHWMNRPLGSIDGYNIMLYRLLQHSSSILGLSLLVFLIWRWYVKKKNTTLPKNSSQPNKRWDAPQYLKKFSLYVLLVVPTVVGIISGFINIPNTDVMYGMYSAQVFIRYFILGSAGSFIVCCALLGLLYQWFIQKNKRDYDLTNT